MGKRVGRALVVAAMALGLLAAAPPRPTAAAETVAFRVPMSDGVELAATLIGEGPLVDGALPPRPTIVELGPYGRASAIPATSAQYNHLEVQLRGTGDSDGAFDALGDRTQLDVVEVLRWACAQPWSTGRLGLWGFSASAIVVYVSLHHVLPCVEAAVLGAGTHDLYRDLMYPGGIPNIGPALVVLAGIGGGSLASGPDRLARDPASSLDALGGMFDTGLQYLAHPTDDGWWQERSMRGNANSFPILMVTGFFDVESRGPFEVFRELHARQPQHHLYVVGAHDGVPAGTGGADAERLAWYDRYLRDVDNGVDRHPAVSLWLADGDREDLLAGRYVRAAGDDWPIAGTTWRTFHLDAARSGTSSALNDGTLADEPGRRSTQVVASLPSLPTATDPNTIATVGIFNDVPLLTDMALAEPLGLAYTTAPLPQDLVAAGPGSVELVMRTSAPESDVLVVLSDVDPAGTAHPVAVGRLRTSFPDIDLDRSIVDADGDVVAPYGRYDAKRLVRPGKVQRYHVELWPIGNRFRAGHRLRLHVLGASALTLPTVPAVGAVRLGPGRSALHLPVLPDGALVPPR